jgi:diguanylate cyclase (GGDEF)-like protein
VPTDQTRVLIVEDLETDADLALRELKRAGMRCVGRRVDTEPDFRRALAEFQPHVILSDFSMPRFDGMEACAIACELCPDVPFIFVSGTIGEEYAIRALKTGAVDYVLKTNLIRLPPAVDRAMRDAEARADARRIEEARRKAEQRLAYLAQFDSLTGLPNRDLFEDRLEQMLAQARRNGWRVGLLLVNLDRFKIVNDTLGHGAGDALLVQAARRLGEAVRSGDTLARFAADEFAVALSNLARADEASAAAQKALDVLARPFDLGGQQVYVSASVGIALHPDDGARADVLLKNADAAKNRVKERGRNSFQFYLPEMNERAAQRLQLETALRGALAREEFALHYQPKLSLVSGAIGGFEALLRWRQPDRGLVAPARFIPILEDTGLIVQVGEWVMASVCAQIKAWQRQGISDRPVAINLSARQFQQPGLDAAIARLIEETGVDPRLIDLEITETLLMRDAEQAARVLKTLKSYGLRIAVDDFGTGYSSLAYLKRFPLDALKIDRAFVRDVTTDADDAAIAIAIIGLAHSVKLKVIAEGVETQAQLRFLREHGCDEIQGWVFAEALPAADCARLVLENRRLDER